MRNRTRMLEWLALALVAYATAAVLAPAGLNDPMWAKLSDMAFKVGHATMAAFVGYWIDRHTLGRVTERATQGRLLARAVIIGSCMLCVSAGL